MGNGSGNPRFSAEPGSRDDAAVPGGRSRWNDSDSRRTNSSPGSEDAPTRNALAEWLTSFSPGIAHCLRNELMILMNSEYGLRSLRESDEPDSREQWVESARTSVARAIQLCESLTDVGLGGSKRGTVNVDCVKLVQAATTLAEHTYMKRGYQIEPVVPDTRVSIETAPEFAREVALGLVRMGLPEDATLSNSSDGDQTARTVRLGVRAVREGGVCFFVDRAAGTAHPADARVREIAALGGARVECVEGDHGSDRFEVTIFDRPTEEDGESPSATHGG